MKPYLLWLGSCALMLSTLAHAGPDDYIFLPSVTYGESEIDFKYGTAKQGEERISAASLGFGYGVSQRWFTEFYAKYHHTGSEGSSFDAWEWENKFQLSEAGEYPVDIGAIIELERPQTRSEGYELRLGPLLQTEFGKTQWNGSILLQRHFRAEGEQLTTLGYQWQAKYRLQPQFEFGLQGFGEMGEWNHWAPRDQQSHRLGPAVFGKLFLGQRQAIRYNAAWLIKASDAAPANNFRLQVEYEF